MVSFRGKEVAGYLHKHWGHIKKTGTVNGLVIESRSNQQLRIVKPLFKNFAGKTIKRFTDNTRVIPGLGLGYAYYAWGNAEHHRNVRAEWP